MASTTSPRDGTILVFSPQGRRPDFSLVLGGPFFQLLRRMRLSGDALELLQRRILVVLAVVWLPLLALSTLEQQAWGGTTAVPFLMDFGANIRFLVTVPLLVGAELFAHQRMRFVVQQFLDRNVIPEGALARFDSAIASAFRLRNSVLAEVIIIALVYIVGVSLLWRHFFALSTAANWFAIPTAEGLKLSRTGWWYAYVSLPVFQFLLMRWYYRFIVWARFLWQVSRIDLSLVPTHPDRVGGLGFLAGVSYAFIPIALAHGAMLAGVIANRIFYLGSALTDFKVEIVVLLLFVLCLVLGPFLVFAPQLVAAKRTGLREYGTLAERYVREFEARWLRGGAPVNEPLVGSADIQSLADLDGSFEVVTKMRLAPITRDALIGLVVATLAPVVPLLFTMISPQELLRKVFGVLF